MIEVVIAVILSVGLIGFAEWKHAKTGNGERFERIHNFINSDRS